MSEINRYIFKLRFKTPVHFGNGRLGASENFLFADTLFSALYKEAINIFGENESVNLINTVESGNLLVSDLFPYIGDKLFVPKPFVSIESDKQGDSTLKKKFKKLKFLPIEDLTDYVNGNYNPDNSVDLMNSMGKNSVVAKVKINEKEDNTPYNIGTYTFNENTGLYFIAMIESKMENMFFEIIDSLSYTGLGGKISSGYGKFDYVYKNVNNVFSDRFNKNYKRYMTLSISLPKDNELEKVIEKANYEVVKRSGFVSSDTYSEKPLRKNNLYCFKSGSVFCDKFSGNVYDVSNKGDHPVYRYAKPMFLGID